jgi:hypothetical protein
MKKFIALNFGLIVGYILTATAHPTTTSATVEFHDEHALAKRQWADRSCRNYGIPCDISVTPANCILCVYIDANVSLSIILETMY